jgi:hypothetical protein
MWGKTISKECVYFLIFSDLDDLYKQYLVPYAPLKSSAAETYFKRMAAIEDAFYT